MNKISFSTTEKVFEKLSTFSQSDILFVDKNIFDTYQKQIETLKMNTITIDDPESKKNIFSYGKYCEELIEAGITRSSVIIAFGGGALSDFAGFIAATILRGVEFHIIPTTLLSMVDASIGGKTAINSEKGKNLIGSFYPASEIIINTEFLTNLPIEEIKSGKGEILKYAFLSKEINKLVLNKAPQEKIINECINYKLLICKNDPKESGERKFLNFGHTFGHAIEFSNKLPHGIAVINGIHIILKLFKEELLNTFYKTLEALEISRDVLIKSDKEIFNFIKRDKKNNAEFIQIVSLTEIGNPEIIPIKLSELEEKFRSYAN